MMKFSRWMAASALAFACPILGAQSARAEMPNYDVKAHCQQVAGVGGTPSQMILAACYQQEQASYDHLKSAWDLLPTNMRAHCGQVASVGGPGSFMLLEACIQQEQSAAQSNSSFTFKR